MKIHRKIVVLILGMLALFPLCNSCHRDPTKYSYKKETTYIRDTTIIKKETFNWELFHQHKGREYANAYDDGIREFITPDSLKIYMSGSKDDDLIYEESYTDSYYSLLKFYYSSTGTLKAEGKEFTLGGWLAGVWNYYDESGKLIKQIDYDKPFRFTIDKVMRYTEKQGLKVPMGYNGEGTRIRRNMFEGKGQWTIEYSGWKYIEIVLDGNSGQVLSRKEGWVHPD